MKKIRSKRAELTTTQIVTLIILVTSFVIILFFVFRLNLQTENTRQICRNSVNLRGSSALGGDAASLNCKTLDVCITKDGECEGVGVNFDLTYKVKDKNEVYSALAEEMASCWWQFGAGEIDYIGSEAFGGKNYCSLCSNVRFDESLKEIFPDGEIDKDDFYKNYLKDTKMPGQEETYSEYLLGLKDPSSLIGQGNEEGTATTFGKINLGNNSFILTGIASETSIATWVVAGVLGGAVLAIALPGLLTVGGILIVAGGGLGALGAGTLYAVTVEGASGNNYISPAIIELGSPEYFSLQCSDIKSIA